MKEAAPQPGDKIGLEHVGSQTVRIPDGQEAERNSWKVHSADELAFKQLGNRLGRSGAKKTTLDYTRDYAERRGVAEHMGVRSEIEIPRELAAAAERQTLARGSLQKVGADLAQDLRADPRKDLAPDRGDERQQRQRRNPFEDSRYWHSSGHNGAQHAV
ncbi:hypothetical protein WH91_19880 [Devosia psychrophila]|uniref:MobA/MobL family protein n=2 Tax=Devosia psychrophila TaxID=728005 RepID=A0ABR5DTN3_9HYPH|nr:hypothetical protein WH91_19880 [Devosia psychrophila]